jgi:single-stranded-DNA-specific exonuclease
VPPLRFEIADCPHEAVFELRRALGVSDAMAQVLVRRGLAVPDAARAFLRADTQHPPSAFAGIGDAVAVILGHLRAGERITVHGDYDVDGVCSTAVLLRALRALGADADSYLPDRVADGYGLSVEVVTRLAERGTRLLITADCAITALDAVEHARGLGLDVVVTDHHAPRPDGVLPRAPIVHPSVCGYPCAELCATAVAHKLAEALIATAGEQELDAGAVADAERGLAEDLDLVALATIADLVPLRDENRRLVREGLRALARTPKPGLRALMAVAGVDPGRVGERSVAFALAPRINAAGRLYRADAGLELILTGDAERARQIAAELDSANRERRQVELGIRYEAEAQMDALGERPAYVIAGEGWHAGVIGIVASRLVERSGRPVVLLATDGDRARGSGRSVDGYDLLAGLRACDEHLERYGGHRAAAGVELASDGIAAFAAALGAHAAGVLGSQLPVEVERVDAVVGGEAIGMDLAEELATLAPHGRGNPTVSLMVADATFADARPMGEGRHVRFTVHSRGARARAVAFGGGARPPVAEGEPARATFTLEVNEWNGVSEPRLVLRRAQAIAEGPSADEREGLGDTRTGQPSTGERAIEARRTPAQTPAEADDGELVLFALP